MIQLQAMGDPVRAKATLCEPRFSRGAMPSPDRAAGPFLLSWYAILPSDLLHRAYGLHGELAWAREDALAVVDLLVARGYRIVSIDMWLPTRPGPTPLIDDWFCDKATMSASDFIRTFQRVPAEAARGGLVPYFAIDAEPAD